MNQEPSDITVSLQKWHRGESEELEALLEQHLDWIKGRVRKRLGDKLRRKVESGDIVQDAILEFLRYGPRFIISDEKQFRALIARIVENVLRDKHDWYTARRRSISQERPLPSETVLYLEAEKRRDRTPSQSAQHHEEEAWIRLGMEVVEHRHREVLVMHLWEHMTFTEIGKQLGIAQNAAWKRYSRALIRLSETVGDLRRGKILDNDENDNSTAEKNHDSPE
jgi:RNA polymerase sigma-70 factor (ECF subfamily)